jgi:hypothetical protein
VEELGETNMGRWCGKGGSDKAFFYSLTCGSEGVMATWVPDASERIPTACRSGFSRTVGKDLLRSVRSQ